MATKDHRARKFIENIPRTEIEIALGRQYLGRRDLIQFVDKGAPEGLALSVGKTDLPFPALVFGLLDVFHVKQPQINHVAIKVEKEEDEHFIWHQQQVVYKNHPEGGHTLWVIELDQIEDIWSKIRKFEITYLYPSHDLQS